MEIRGDGPVLGRNVLAVGFETSFPGTNRPSSIQGSGTRPTNPTELDSSVFMQQVPRIKLNEASAAWGGQYIHGISAPMKELEERMIRDLKETHAKHAASQKVRSTHMAQPTEHEMKAANLGVKLAPETAGDDYDSRKMMLDAKRFKTKVTTKSRAKTNKRKN